MRSPLRSGTLGRARVPLLQLPCTLTLHLPCPCATPRSFGVCLWEIATQERPIRGRMRPLKCPRDCPQDVAALVAACMDPKPSMRPSAQQLVERLLAAPADAPLGAGEGREAPAQPPRSVSMAVRSPAPGGSASPQPDPQALRSSAPAARPLGWMQQAAPGHDAIEGPSAGAEAPGPAMPQAGPTLPAGSAKGMPWAASSPADMARPCDMVADVYGIGMF